MAASQEALQVYNFALRGQVKSSISPQKHKTIEWHGTSEYTTAWLERPEVPDMRFFATPLDCIVHMRREALRAWRATGLP